MLKAARSAPIIDRLAGLVLLTCVCLHPASAQSLEELDRLSRSSENVQDGLALARSQVETGALLEALATLDRTLALKPKDKEARLLHASILCLIDDRVGASVEFARLKAKHYSEAQWTSARAPCTTNDKPEEAAN